MLDEIKQRIFTKYKPEESKWLFFSTFNKSWTLIASNWVIESDKEIDKMIDLLYHGILENQTDVQKIIIDVVTELHEETNIQEILKLSPIEHWLCLANSADRTKSWVLLPNTQWVTTIKQALLLIKQKHQLTGQVAFFVFNTDRFELML